MKTKSNLGIIRRIVGLKGTEVADITGIPIQNIRTWESGIRRPLVQNLLIFSDLYSELIHNKVRSSLTQKQLEDNAGQNDPKLKRLLNSYFSLDYILHRQITDVDIALLTFAYSHRLEFSVTDRYFSTYQTVQVDHGIEDTLEFDTSDPSNPHVGLRNQYMAGYEHYKADDYLTDKFWKV